MRKLSILIAAATLGAAAPALAASPVAGQWRTPKFHGVVEISDCGDGICGRVIDSDRIKADPELKDSNNKKPELKNRPIKNLEIFHGFKGGPKAWKGSGLYNPEDGGTYSGSITLLDPNKVKLTGCIVWPACKSETWTRIK
jgi:uncharacterized protein (DUF2147 family)